MRVIRGRACVHALNCVDRAFIDCCRPLFLCHIRAHGSARVLRLSLLARTFNALPVATMRLPRRSLLRKVPWLSVRQRGRYQQHQQQRSRPALTEKIPAAARRLGHKQTDGVVRGDEPGALKSVVDQATTTMLRRRRSSRTRLRLC